MYEYHDQTLTCIDCNEEFFFTAGEQQFFADKGLKNAPKRCKTCKAKKNERLSQAYAQGLQHERLAVCVTCALCGTETTIPFHPTQGRPVYCRDCFLKMRGATLRFHTKVS